MESFFSRYRNALVLIAVLLAQTLGLAVQVRRTLPGQPDRGPVRLIRYWMVSLVAPPERVAHGTGSVSRSWWMNYVDMVHVRRQNRELQAEIDRMKLQEASLAEDALEGQRLKQLLDFKGKYVYQTVAAQVIGASGADQSRVLYIDKGSHDGIKADMPVITPDGIVGKTRDVFPHTSQVLMISDPASGAGVVLETTRIRGVLRGNAMGQPEIVNVMPDERIKAGEKVVTSGGDQIFPRGLPVGTVEKMVDDPDHEPMQDVLIKPGANLAQLEEVLVVTSTGDQMPKQDQKDLDQAELDNMQQRASDILAERLPSRVDPNAPPLEQQGATSDNLADVTRPMRPLQALHPDRYSPDETPPAADLTPGAHSPDVSSGKNVAPMSAAQMPAAKPRGPKLVPSDGSVPPPHRTPATVLPGTGAPKTAATPRTTVAPRTPAAVPKTTTAPRTVTAPRTTTPVQVAPKPSAPKPGAPKSGAPKAAAPVKHKGPEIVPSDGSTPPPHKTAPATPQGAL
ncbi:rod shape-determining protein MreC [Acidipila rosea]|uniref:Cell shape-determining protein MreC n=1 Tax=Acidipila rosea TaxID=768535 RepID=A0A4R1L6X1_9BACT|nr:rod shape-determining protein MreC [Acidipila rosea]TCK72039.1 rod shape-determining protein MreC [Acidipila rosea]